MPTPDPKIYDLMVSSFRKSFSEKRIRVLDYLMNRDLLDLFEGRDEIDFRSAVVWNYRESENYIDRRTGVWRIASKLKWGVANGLVEHRDIREPDEQFVIVDRRQHFIVCGKDGLRDLRIIDPTLPPPELEKALKRERSSLKRNRPDLIEKVAHILGMLMDKHPEAPLPTHLRYLEKPGHPYLRSYYDILVDAACDLNGLQVIAELYVHMYALNRAARRADYMAETDAATEVDEDDAFALDELNFSLALRDRD